MKKRFISKKKIKYKLIKLISIICIVFLSFVYALHFFVSFLKDDLNEEAYIKYLTNETLGSNDLSDSFSLINTTNFIYKYTMGTDVKKLKKEEKQTFKISNDVETINDEPIIYIYNTHQTESYKTNFLESFNINNTVLIASYILKEYLSDLKVVSIVEENKIKDILDYNNWSYGYSYKASRILLEQAKVNNPSLKYFIDIHRDSSNYENTVTEIDGKKYAKVLFIVGLENPKYEANLANANVLNERIKKINPSLSRGVLKKQGIGVNGVYNQDFDPQTFLIEIGGQYNTIEEINNTLKILASVLYEYIESDEYETQET